MAALAVEAVKREVISTFNDGDRRVEGPAIVVLLRPKACGYGLSLNTQSTREPLGSGISGARFRPRISTGVPPPLTTATY